MERHLSTYPGETVKLNGSLDRVKIDDAKQTMLGYEQIKHIPKSSFRDNSMCIIIPTRDDTLHVRFVQAFNALMKPMNNRAYTFFVSGAEVGKAYTETIQGILSTPELASCKYILSIEDDMLVPPEAIILLCESIEVGPFTAAAGFYWTKGDFSMPQVYGSIDEYARTGRLDYRPLDPSEALARGHLIECMGVAMGCTLYRMEIFKKMNPPWFETIQDPARGASTQDLAFCRRAKLEHGARFVVDARVRCGHADWASGRVY